MSARRDCPLYPRGTEGEPLHLYLAAVREWNSHRERLARSQGADACTIDDVHVDLVYRVLVDRTFLTDVFDFAPQWTVDMYVRVLNEVIMRHSTVKRGSFIEIARSFRPMLIKCVSLRVNPPSDTEVSGSWFLDGMIITAIIHAFCFLTYGQFIDSDVDGHDIAAMDRFVKEFRNRFAAYHRSFIQDEPVWHFADTAYAYTETTIEMIKSLESAIGCAQPLVSLWR